MNSEIEVPDGGWGWAVVAGTAIINVFNQSLLSMFGLIFGTKLKSVAGATGVTTVMSINCTVSNFSGFLISPLSKYFSTKQITQIGVLLVSIGLACSSYTKSYTAVTIGYGVLTGLGLGLIASSTFLIINSYFDKNKSQAVGLSMAGTSVGQMGMPPIVALLIEHYGYNGTILILSGLSLHGLMGAMFFEPVSEHILPRNRPRTKSCFSRFRDRICCLSNQKPVVTENNIISNRDDADVTNKYGNNNDREANLIKTELENSETVIYDKYDISKEITATDLDNEKIADTVPGNDESEDECVISDETQSHSGDGVHSSILQNGNKNEEEEMMLPPAKVQNQNNTCQITTKSCWDKIVELFDLHILLDTVFVHIMIGLSLAYTTSVSFSTFFPLFLKEDLDMSIIEASTCMSVLSFMDFVGRILVPLVTKQMDITHRTIFIIGSFILAICRSVLAVQNTYTMVIVVSAVCGLARAATVINQNLVIAEYSKEAHVSSAVGLNMVSKGFFVLTIGRLLGMYKDSKHNYSGCIHILNVISLGVVFSWSSEMVLRRLYRKKNAKLSK